MSTSREHFVAIATLHNALLADIATAYAVVGGEQRLFAEPWPIGPDLSDDWPYVAGGIARRDGQLFVLDPQHGGSYALDKLDLNDLRWVLMELEELNHPLVLAQV